MLTLVTSLLLTLLTCQIYGQQENVVGYTEPEVTDILNQSYVGRCLTPRICLDKGHSCGIDNDHHVIVNCSHRQVGPYAPNFQPYILPRRTWEFDFSHNGITDLDSYSFFTSGGIAVNLTKIDLSNNYVRKISANTFRGEVSKELMYIDLSFNSLEGLEKGVFDQSPKLQTLLLFNNRLLTIDALCVGTFPALTSLDLQFNRVSGVPSKCFSSAANKINVNLDYNYLGSMDDCSYDFNHVELSFAHNPLLCGCSQQFSGSKCLKLDSNNATVSATQPSCSSSGCTNLTFDTSVEWSNGEKGLFTAIVKVPEGKLYTVDLLQYSHLGNESVSAKLINRNTAVSSEFKGSDLEAKSHYSACFTATDDAEGRQRKCHYIVAPEYFVASASAVRAALYLVIASLVVVWY